MGAIATATTTILAPRRKRRRLTKDVEKIQRRR